MRRRVRLTQDSMVDCGVIWYNAAGSAPHPQKAPRALRALGLSTLAALPGAARLPVGTSNWNKIRMLGR